MMKKYVKSFTVFIIIFAITIGAFFGATPINAYAANELSASSFWDGITAEPEDDIGDASIGDADFATIGDAEAENLGDDDWPFSDLWSNAIGATEARTLYQAGIIKGFGYDSKNKAIFKPLKPVTRAQFAVMLYKFAVLCGAVSASDTTEISKYQVTYQDIPKSGEIYEAIRFFDYYHIITGFSSTKYKPNNNITRAQISIILIKFARTIGADTTARESLTQKKYLDLPSLQFDVLDSMSWCIKGNIISGVKKGNVGYLKGNDTATRLQCCMFIYRLPYCLFNGETNINIQKYTKWTSNKSTANTYHIIAYSPNTFEPTKTTPFFQLKNFKLNMIMNFSFSNQKTFGAAKADIMANESSHKEKLSWTHNGTNDYVSYGYVESEKQYYLQRARLVNGKIVTASAVFPAGNNYDYCYDQAIAFITGVTCEYK